MTAAVHDLRRLVEALGAPGLERLCERLRLRIERGQPLAGGLQLPDVADEERDALQRLFGRTFKGRSLRVDLDELALRLRAAKISDDLASAIHGLYGGRIVDHHARVRALEMAWHDVFASARATAGSPAIVDFIVELERSGLLRRLSPQGPPQGERLLRDACAVAGALPRERPTPLPVFASDVLRDSHALDIDRPVSAIALRYIAQSTGLCGWQGRDQRREAWASVGVLCDELSAPVLVLNLRLHDDGPIARILDLHADTGEPCRLSTRQLARKPPRWTGLDRVFVCENPAVLAAAADDLGPAAAPMICVEGQPSTPARLLLAQLTRAGSTLVYHGDFDWAGLSIANLIMREHGAAPWRMSCADYLAAAPTATLALAGEPVEASWDSELSSAMRHHNLVVHEEQVLSELLADLHPRDG